MAVQLGDRFDIHSKNWYDVQDQFQKEFDEQEHREQILALEQRYADATPEEDHHPTVDMRDLYDDITLMTGDSHDIHSKNWYKQQDMTENILRHQPNELEEAPASHHDTVNQGELYNGMALQLGGIHSENYERMMAQQEKEFNAAEAER